MALNHPEIEAILDRIRKARNFDFRNYKRATLVRRIEHRMHERSCRSAAEYAALLDREPEEFNQLVSRLLIKVTSFFRDPNLWGVLSRKILPEILSSKGPGEEVRIWSAGCATGEETYSIAILVAEALGKSFATYPVKVFGTDVDEAAIAYARRGIYGAEPVRDLPKPLLNRYLQQGPEGWTVRKELRRVVVFGVNNLVSDAPISRLDLIICRNVFIYLDNELQKRVLARFHYALRPHGMLMLGKSELVPFASKIFEPVDLSSRIYRKDHRREVPLGAQERLVGLLEQEHLAGASAPAEENHAMAVQLYREVLDALPVPAIVTALDGTVNLWSRAAARTWGRTEADVLGKKVAALGLPGLSGDLLIEKTARVREGQSDRESSEGTLNGTGSSAPTVVKAEVSALRKNREGVVALLYTVQDVTQLRAVDAELRRAQAEVTLVNERLRSSIEELRSSNEELETTNEELQSANEELQTTNEELQSTNEELETTNEELQSTNAELDATNRELAHRTEELDVMNFYQRTVVRSLSAAVVALDPHGRISGWNLAAERLLGLPEREAIGQLLWSLHIPALSSSYLQRIRKALGAGRALRAEQIAYNLPTGGKGYATVAAIPLVEREHQLGAVILFEDTTRVNALSRELEEARSGPGAPPLRRRAARKPRSRVGRTPRR